MALLLTGALTAHITAADTTLNPYNTSPNGLIEPFSLRFQSTKNGALSHHIFFDVEPIWADGQAYIGLITTLSGELIYEKNISFLDENQHLTYIHQLTDNEEENSHFAWEIENQGPRNATYIFVNHIDKTQEAGKTKLPKNGYSIQALLYLLHKRDIYQDNLAFKLLVPPAQFYDMYGKRVREEKIHIEDRHIETVKLEFGLSGLIGLFAPKTYFWMTKTKPHLPVKYQSRDLVVELDGAYIPN